MKRVKTMAIVGCLAAVLVADEGDGFNGDLFSGWRFSAGGALNGNMRSKIGVRPGRALTGMYGGGGAVATQTRAEAKAAGDAYNLGDGLTTYPNGAFIDPSDSSGVHGQTWNWHVPAGALDANRKMTFVNSYSEALDVGTTRDFSAKSDDYAAGFSMGMDREVWRWGKLGFDFGLGVSYFRNRDFFKADGRVYERTESSASGDYVSEVAFHSDIFDDPWAQNADGSYGAGTFDGPGPMLDLNAGDVTVSHRWANQVSSSRTSSYYMSVRGDYEELEMLFAVRPFWEVTDWFRVRGTLGAAVSRTHFVFDVYGRGDGASYASRQTFNDWAVYGVGGLGGLFSWNGVCLGFDFLARFLDSDIDIHGRDVHGSVSRAPWMFTVYVGYEF